MAIIYGRFTDAELERRGDDPYVWEGDRCYQLTEVVRRMDGGANYQAKEYTGPVAPAQPLPEADVVESEPESEPYEPAAMDVPPTGPPLKTWARENGWRGRGPISQPIRQKYIDEFGVAAYEWQRA